MRTPTVGEIADARYVMLTTFRRDGTAVPAPIWAVRDGDALVVRPGEVVPCDGEVVDGRSDVDTSRLPGEPLPRAVAPGASVMSGMLNGSGAFVMRATARSGESQYARIVELVRSAEASKSPFQRLADRYAGWFSPVTVLVRAVAWLASGRNEGFHSPRSPRSESPTLS